MKNRGFTKLELILAIAMLAVIAALLFGAKFREQAPVPDTSMIGNTK